MLVLGSFCPHRSQLTRIFRVGWHILWHLVNLCREIDCLTSGRSLDLILEDYHEKSMQFISLRSCYVFCLFWLWSLSYCHDIVRITEPVLECVSAGDQFGTVQVSIPCHSRAYGNKECWRGRGFGMVLVRTMPFRAIWKQGVLERGGCRTRMRAPPPPPPGWGRRLEGERGREMVTYLVGRGRWQRG